MSLSCPSVPLWSLWSRHMSTCFRNLIRSKCLIQSRAVSTKVSQDNCKVLTINLKDNGRYSLSDDAQFAAATAVVSCLAVVDSAACSAASDSNTVAGDTTTATGEAVDCRKFSYMAVAAYCACLQGSLLADSKVPSYASGIAAIGTARCWSSH